MRLLFRTGIFILILTLAALPSQAQDSRSLVRVHIPGYSPSSLPFQIAEEQGFYQEEGLNVRTLRMKTGAGIQAMLAGDIDVSQITGPTVLAAILQGVPLNVSAFVSNGLISENFQEKVLDFELKAIGTEKKVHRDKVFDFSVMKSLAAN